MQLVFQQLDRVHLLLRDKQSTLQPFTEKKVRYLNEVSYTRLRIQNLGFKFYISYLLLLLLSCFSRVQFCATPQTAGNQATPSLGFYRQEHWSGLPFPSPVHACMLSHFSHARLCATPWTAAHQGPLSMGFSRQEYWSSYLLKLS